MKSDTQLKKEVLDELEWAPNVDANKIGVIVKDGSVSLTGTVVRFTDKLAAETATKRVKGVRAIAQDIDVKLSTDTASTDGEIAEKISHIFQWSASLANLDIQARVSNGYVTLTGKVKWPYQRKSAEQQIQDLHGVTSIFNTISIRKPDSLLTATDIKKQITGALHRRANLEASKVSLIVADGKVTVNGTVDSYYERELIENAVWSCDGVKDVVDHLRVV